MWCCWHYCSKWVLYMLWKFRLFELFFTFFFFFFILKTKNPFTRLLLGDSWFKLIRVHWFREYIRHTIFHSVVPSSSTFRFDASLVSLFYSLLFLSYIISPSVQYDSVLFSLSLSFLPSFSHLSAFPQSVIAIVCFGKLVLLIKSTNKNASAWAELMVK